MSAVRWLLSLRTLPGLQCDFCRERQENRTRQKDALEELFVRQLGFATVLFQLVRNTLQGPSAVDHRIGVPTDASGVFARHQRSPLKGCWPRRLPREPDEGDLVRQAKLVVRSSCRAYEPEILGAQPGLLGDELA